MTPKQEALELIQKYLNVDFLKDFEGMNLELAKECSIIAIDEIDNIYQKLTPKDNPYFYLFQLEYWQEVKQEVLTYQP
jgi:hypothetical protein